MLQPVCLALIRASQLSISLQRSASPPDTCACSFDLEQTSPSFSALAPLFSMFARALFTDRSRLPFVAVQLAGSRDQGIDGSRCCIAGQFEHGGRKDKKRAQGGEGRYGRGRRRGRNSRVSFLDGWRPVGKKSDASHDDERQHTRKRERDKEREGEM